MHRRGGRAGRRGATPADTGRDVAVRGGGHSVPGFGTADDAIVVDLSDLTRM